jgi:ribonuclease R
MTYTQVQKILDGDRHDNQPRRVHPTRARVRADARARAAAQRKRHRRGSIDFDLPEPVIQFDPQGNMAAIVRSERGWSHRLIEEFMLSANECVAHWLEARAIPSIYRIHEMPDPKRILDFEETAAASATDARLLQSCR